MHKLINPLLSLTAILLAVSLWVHHFIPGSGAKTEKSELYRPGLEHDPPVPHPPPAAVRDFNTFLDRLREASESSTGSLVLHRDALVRAEQVFHNTVGVPDNVMIMLHSPFFTVDPEAIFALYFDLPTLERGLGLFQQHCSQCHGP